jgi:hypothetical protein
MDGMTMGQTRERLVNGGLEDAIGNHVRELASDRRSWPEDDRAFSPGMFVLGCVACAYGALKELFRGRTKH